MNCQTVSGRKREQRIRVLRMLVDDEEKIQKFNNYQPAVIALFVLAFVLVSIASIYAAATMPECECRDVILGTNFTGWVLLIVVAILYGVSITAPSKPDQDED